MRWLRWDPSQRPRSIDVEWLWDDLKLPAAARSETELPDEFYIARSGSPGLHLTTLSTSRYDRLKPFWAEAFDAEMGAEPILEFLKLLDLDLDQERYYTELEMRATSSQIRTKAGKRMRLLETFRRSENRMQDMIMTVLPVLPPELRPMVQLDGGRFATSDLNDLYRRVLSRNHRLKRFASMRAPGLMIRNEKRMLQEAVDSLIDNGRQGKAVKGKRDHALKSLSDLLKGKQGRFRQNLLGKRVDYSGRSVIVVGPELKMDECGLPKRMALELFKPFVMHRLVLNALAPNIKAAKRMVERSSPEVWHILEDVIKDRPVMLNRAPTLHRLGIQAFKPVLIEGSAIQLHPLVCSAFNADFDGDQMAVHVPLSAMAVYETGSVMLSTNNMLSPASGDPLVAPTLDMVMGCYYLTELAPEAKGAGGVFYDIDEARIAYSDGQLDLRAPITVLKVPGADGKTETTMGRLIFNETIPDALGYKNQLMDRGAIKDLTSELYRNLSNEETAIALDSIKEMGFYYATKSGITIAINDIQVSERKRDILDSAGQKVAEHEDNFMMGMMTEEEKYERIIDTWTQASDDMQQVVEAEMANYGGVAVMAKSGAKGNISQIKQMAGMRGLMSDPEGRIIERPVKSSFREGLTALEYFISTHGARKGLTDTALRTADSGYLTRRLVDVSQEVIVQESDCEFAEPFYVEPRPNDPTLSNLPERIVGRMAGDVIANPVSGEIIVDRNEMIDEGVAVAIRDAGIDRVPVRSPLTCQTRRGICQMCYGRLPATGQLVEIGQAVGVIAAQSIGEPGTQLTMRTFHTGGIAGSDITTGLPRVQELFEVRPPKGAGVLTHIDGAISIEEDPNGSRRIRVTYDEEERHDYALPSGAIRLVERGEPVEEGKLLAVVLNTQSSATTDGEGESSAALANTDVVNEIRSDFQGEAEVSADGVTVVWREEESRVYDVSSQMTLKVTDGQQVMAGDALVDGPLDLRELLDIRGLEGLQHYLVDEVQEVYRSQGVSIHDKHIEVILRQMLRRVQVETAGDTEFIPGDVVDKFRFQDQNAQVLAEGGEPATAKTLLLGVSKAALTTDSFLSKASFQETTKVLTMAAVASDRDWLRGLKENVIIGRLIPARLDSLLQAEHEFALREVMDDFAGELAPSWLSGDGDIPEEFAGLNGADELIDEELIAGQTLSQFGGTGIGDAGFQIRTAEEEDELVRRAQSLTESDSEIDREVELSASRIFSPFEEEDEDIPRL
ncbi:MAG: DNA-directed RNA polymerase subunit beta' [Chloroflexota bacterium]|nr:DNA-directed RNA polymerase subunit beta' [Chloroflexota bacterium]